MAEGFLNGDGLVKSINNKVIFTQKNLDQVLHFDKKSRPSIAF